MEGFPCQRGFFWTTKRRFLSHSLEGGGEGRKRLMTVFLIWKDPEAVFFLSSQRPPYIKKVPPNSGVNKATTFMYTRRRGLGTPCPCSCRRFFFVCSMLLMPLRCFSCAVAVCSTRVVYHTCMYLLPHSSFSCLRMVFSYFFYTLLSSKRYHCGAQ